ncbi:LysR family transcriptional regulator [Paraburkholderia bryophila]|uniref:DNA-binding transcriptional LysR family regulator n=1 Tax=Paraburkholderia bryophila TaxID=420952 RepID=A0A7Z0AZQ3_9BURK|nr:LysR family transcriptional regulator [Paraburkholderia bryophila]NYH14780.1 DNA-binding transcriptional LysR family regulator [Paraburkholderia bryophila]
MDRLIAMETFIGVIEAGSFSAAARRLNVGQPAVSKSIAQLEERLGVRLLLRSTRGLTPTDAGQKFYERAKRVIEEADEAELAVRISGASLSGRLRVCAPVTFARLRIVPSMKAFLAAHPGLTLEVVLDDRHIDLLEEGIDVALRMGALGDSSMTARKIGQSRRIVVGTPAYFELAGTPNVPADLITHEAIIYEQRGGGATWSFKRGSSETAVAVSGRMRVTAAEGVRAAVLADMGVAIASEWMFAPELASGAVKAVVADWTLPPVDLWAVFPTGRMASAKARAFVAFVEATLGLAAPTT